MKRLVLVQLLFALQGALAFVSFLDARAHHHGATELTMGRKLSFAEKRKRRAKKQPRPVTGTPVKFNRPLVVETKEEEAPAETSDTPPIQRAQELLQAQRKSVSTC